MIAPLDEFRESDGASQTMLALRRARRMVASMILTRQAPANHASPQVPSWKAWLFAGWVAATFVIYGLAWIGAKLSQS